MRKFRINVFIILILFIVFQDKNKILAANINNYSTGFIYMIEAMKIEKENINGFKINEDIYNKYKLIVYGDPISINNNKQRWKDTETGKWITNGRVGEYWILGEDYAGNLVHNELFPDDYNSGTSPLNWNYRVVKDAENSWNDTSLYLYESQREYMLSQKLSRFGVTYDLTALDIGIDKAKVENYATWGSAGSIYTEKPGEGNIYWAATFSVPPMAKNAKLESILEFPNGTEYTISLDQNEIEIPYIYGAQIGGLSEFTKAEHVKVIESELKINGVRNELLSDSEKIKISKNGSIVINRSSYSGKNKITLKVETNSFASTYFPNDPVMYSSKEIVITINIKNEEILNTKIENEKNAPVIYELDISRISTSKSGRKEYVPLYFNNKTRKEFICAGQVIRIRIKTSANAKITELSFGGFSSITKLDNTTKRFLWDEPRSRKETTIFSSEKEFKNSFKLPRNLELIEERAEYKIFEGIYVIPYETTQTLHSWNSLRSESQDAFKIDESKLFTRKESPYKLVIKAHSQRWTSTNTYELDVAERWDTLFNRDIYKYIK